MDSKHMMVLASYTSITYQLILESRLFQVDLDHLVVHQGQAALRDLVALAHQKDPVCHDLRTVLAGLEFPLFRKVLQNIQRSVQSDCQ